MRIVADAVSLDNYGLLHIGHRIPWKVLNEKYKSVLFIYLCGISRK
jgi:hypothetical protein